MILTVILSVIAASRIFLACSIPALKLAAPGARAAASYLRLIVKPVVDATEIVRSGSIGPSAVGIFWFESDTFEKSARDVLATEFPPSPTIHSWDVAEVFELQL